PFSQGLFEALRARAGGVTMAKKDEPGPVQRWVDETSGTQLDAHLGEIFRAVPEEGPLSPGALASVGRRIARDGRRGARRDALRSLPAAFAVLPGAGGAAFGQWARPGFWHLKRHFAPSVAALPEARPPMQAEMRVAPVVRDAPKVEDVAALEAPAGPRARSAPDRPRAPEAAPAPIVVEPVARPGPIALESELLQKALAKLRRDHDAGAALALLDDYRARFPLGVLSVEASVARVDALLLLGRRSDALAVLGRLALDGVGRSTELHLLRAE